MNLDRNWTPTKWSFFKQTVAGRNSMNSTFQKISFRNKTAKRRAQRVDIFAVKKLRLV